MSKFCLNNGEEIILKTQGTVKTNFSLTQGHLYLTNQRIVFMQVFKQIFDIALDKIIDVSVEKKEWLFGCRVKHLCIRFKGGKRQKREYIAIANTEIWRDVIKESITFMLMERWGDNGAIKKPTSNT